MLIKLLLIYVINNSWQEFTKQEQQQIDLANLRLYFQRIKNK